MIQFLEGIKCTQTLFTHTANTTMYYFVGQMSQNHNLSLCSMFDNHQTPRCLLLSYHLTLSAAFTSLITPSYYIPITLHYGLQSCTMVLTSCQVRAGTAKHTPKHTQDTVTDSLSHKPSFLPWYVFCSTPDMNPSSSCLAQGKDPPTGSTLHYTATTSSAILSSIWNHSAVVQLQFGSFFTSTSSSWPLPQLCSLISGSRPPGPGQAYQHQGSALPIRSHNHTTQSKLTSRFLGLAQWVCVTPLP